MRTSTSLHAVVLAGGQGVRMRSDMPKALHQLCGRPMLLYVLDAVRACEPRRITVVIGPGSESLVKLAQEEASGPFLDFVEQVVPRGTAHAVQTALAATEEDVLDDVDILVVPGDVPLVHPATLSEVVSKHREGAAAATLLTADLGARSGYGRVVRGGRDGSVRRVVLDSRATEPELAVDEVSAGIAVFRRSLLSPALRRVYPDGVVGELHLSDVVEVLTSTGHRVDTVETVDAETVRGINDRTDLVRAEGELRRRTNVIWLERGVRMVDPDHTYLDTTVTIGADVLLHPGTILSGRTVIGDGAEIGPFTRLLDCTVGAGSRVEMTVGLEAHIGPDAVVGPFAYLERGSELPPGSVTGAHYAGDGHPATEPRGGL